MHPIETTYQLAASSKDYIDCHLLYEAENGKPSASAFRFPTILAKRDNVLIGFFSTVPDHRHVIAGPLVIKGGKNPIMAMRLMEAYDVVMVQQGITLYYFTVDANRTDALSIERLEEMGMKHWETRENIAWFKKEL